MTRNWKEVEKKKCPASEVPGKQAICLPMTNHNSR